VIRAHQPGSEPIDIPETIPNPVVVPKPTPTPTEPAPKEPVRIPDNAPPALGARDSRPSAVCFISLWHAGNDSSETPIKARHL
jgi:hypothetical protein